MSDPDSLWAWACATALRSGVPPEVAGCAWKDAAFVLAQCAFLASCEGPRGADLPCSAGKTTAGGDVPGTAPDAAETWREPDAAVPAPSCSPPPGFPPLSPPRPPSPATRRVKKVAERRSWKAEVERRLGAAIKAAGDAADAAAEWGDAGAARRQAERAVERCFGDALGRVPTQGRATPRRRPITGPGASAPWRKGPHHQLFLPNSV